MSRRYMPNSVWNAEMDAEFARFVPGHSQQETIDHMRDVFGVELTVSQVKNRKCTLGVKSGTVGGQFSKGDGAFKDEEHRRKFMEAGKRTRFKKGQLPKRKDGWMKPVGYERTNVYGYVEVKVHDGLQDRPNRNYRQRSHIVWEEHNGPIPKGHVIVHIDGNKTNDDISNLRCIPQGKNQWINNTKRFRSIEVNEDTFDTVSLLADVAMTAKKRRKEAKDGRSGD